MCNGRVMAQKPWSGALTANNEPIFIGAASFDGESRLFFTGEMEEAAIWSRVLNDEELGELAHGP